MKIYLGSLRVHALAAAIVAASGLALATPIIGVGNAQKQSWQQGINNGSVVPTTKPLTTPAQKFLQQQVNNQNLAGFQQLVPVLKPVTITLRNGQKRTVLVNSWVPAKPSTLNVTGTSYMYHADPNLTNFEISDDAFSPRGISDLGVELIDTNGNAAGWFTSAPELRRPDDYTLNVEEDKSQGQFNFFSEDPGFSLTDVIEVRLEQASVTGAAFPPDPDGSTDAWDAYDSLDAVPEPAPVAAVGLGVLGLVLGSRSRRAR